MLLAVSAKRSMRRRAWPGARTRCAWSSLTNEVLRRLSRCTSRRSGSSVAVTWRLLRRQRPSQAAHAGHMSDVFPVDVQRAFGRTGFGVELQLRCAPRAAPNLGEAQAPRQPSQRLAGAAQGERGTLPHDAAARGGECAVEGLQGLAHGLSSRGSLRADQDGAGACVSGAGMSFLQQLALQLALGELAQRAGAVTVAAGMAVHRGS